jgi:hypothetical protein
MYVLRSLAYKESSGGDFGRGDSMSTKGKVNVGCGLYSYEIVNPSPPAPPTLVTPPPVAPTLGRQECFPDDGSANTKDSTQDRWARFLCDKEVIFKGEGDFSFWVPHTSGGKLEPYRYLITWIKGCKTTEAQQAKLLPLKDNPQVTCYSLLRENYKNCK